MVIRIPYKLYMNDFLLFCHVYAYELADQYKNHKEEFHKKMNRERKAVKKHTDELWVRLINKIIISEKPENQSQSSWDKNNKATSLLEKVRAVKSILK